MKINKLFLFLFIILGLVSTGIPSLRAADTGDDQRKQMIEMNQKIVKKHQEMIKCLKSKKTVDECRQEMHQNCPMMQGGKDSMMQGGCCGMMQDGNCPMGQGGSCSSMKDGGACPMSGAGGSGMGMGKSDLAPSK